MRIKNTILKIFFQYSLKNFKTFQFRDLNAHERPILPKLHQNFQNIQNFLIVKTLKRSRLPNNLKNVNSRFKHPSLFKTSKTSSHFRHFGCKPNFRDLEPRINYQSLRAPDVESYSSQLEFP